MSNVAADRFIDFAPRTETATDRDTPVGGLMHGSVEVLDLRLGRASIALANGDRLAVSRDVVGEEGFGKLRIGHDIYFLANAYDSVIAIEPSRS